MSTAIADEITRILGARNDIRDKLIDFGLATSTDRIDALATAVEGIANRGAVSAQVQEGDTYTIPAGYHNGSGTVSGVSGGGNYSLQSKSVTPTKSQQSITPDSGYYGLSDVTVAAIPEAYQNVSSVTATAGDVLATKVIVTSNGTVTTGTMPNNGAVSKTLDATTGNQSYTVPTGYHNGSGKVQIVLESKTATPTKASQTVSPTNGKVLSSVTVNPIPADYQDVSGVTATASDVLAGKVFVDSAGEVIEGTVGNGTLAASATGSATVSSVSYTYNSSSDKFNVTGSGAISGTATATVTDAGVVSASTTGTGTTTGTASVAATVNKIAGSTAITGTTKVTPSISRTTTTATGATNVGTGDATTAAPSSGYYVSVQSGAAESTITATPSVSSAGYGTASNHGITGNTAAVGANASSVTYITVPGGSASAPASISGTGASVSAGTNTLTLTKTVSVTPDVSAGYVASGTAGNSSVSLTASVTTKGAATYYPSNSDQTIAASQYLTGAQTIKKVTTANISAANVKDGVVVKVGDTADDDRILAVTGTFTDASTVSSGQTAAAAGQILTGYSAWVDGAEVKGSIANNGAINGTIDGLTTMTYNVAAGYTSGGTVTLTDDIENALAAI